MYVWLQTWSIGSDEPHPLPFGNLGFHILEEGLVLARAVAVGQLAQLYHTLTAAMDGCMYVHI